MHFKNCFYIIAFFSFFFSGKLSAQEGKMLNIWGGGQATWLNNREEYQGLNNNSKIYISQKNTLLYSLGVDYIHNFDYRWGYSTGLSYSKQGQNYAGTTDTSDDPKVNKFVKWNSHVYLDYVKIPMLFRFNTSMNENTYGNICIYMGLQLCYLINADVATTPADTPSVPVGFNYKNLFNTLDVTMVSGLQINLWPSDKWGLSIGSRFDRGLIGMENNNFDYKNTHLPNSLYFPISTWKYIKPSADDFRASTKNSTLSVYISLIIPLKNFDRVNKTPFRMDDNNPTNDQLDVQ